MFLKSSVFKFLIILVLFAFSINIPPYWKLTNSDPEYGLREYELNLDENQVFTVSCRDVKGSKRLALSFISVDKKFPQYHWCYFVDGKMKRSTPYAYGVFTELMKRGIFHTIEGLPADIRTLIEEALYQREREKRQEEIRRRISIEYASEEKTDFRGIFLFD